MGLPALLRVAVCGLGLSGALALAETAPRIEDRWSVVGVIAGEETSQHEPTGIAVLRNNLSQKSYTLTIGDPVPTEFGFVLKRVLARSVIIASPQLEVTLTFSEAVTESTADSRDTQAGRTSRFLENYYRGFDAGSEDALEDAGSDDELPPAMAVPRLGVTRIERPTHLGTYRTPHPYHFDEDEESGTSAPVFGGTEDEDGFEAPRPVE